mmetsp:Transcript_73684/g.213472  ORF Transcript_73684/g.213472 Transcript_73684/m.213472 type:complete len:265 (-) Transcript_73684:2846-3640(-)
MVSIHSRSTALPTPCSSLKRTSNSPQRSSEPSPVPSIICCLMASICSVADWERSPSTNAKGGSVMSPSMACCDLWCRTSRLINQTRFSGTLIRCSNACSSACVPSSCVESASNKLQACDTSACNLPLVSGQGGGMSNICSGASRGPPELLELPPKTRSAAPGSPKVDVIGLLVSTTSHPRLAATDNAAPSGPPTMKAGIGGAFSPNKPIRKRSIPSKLLKTTTAEAPAWAAAATACAQFCTLALRRMDRLDIRIAHPFFRSSLT